MHDQTLSIRSMCVAVLVAVAGCEAGAPGDPAFSADDLAASPTISMTSAPMASAPMRESDGSLAAFTAEVRQLRMAIEQLARSQANAQALGAALSNQQRRVEHITQQLDVARREVEGATERSREFDRQAAHFSQELSSASDRHERARLETMLRSIEVERDAVERALQSARGRENELSRTLALEEDRWNDLLARAGQAGR